MHSGTAAAWASLAFTFTAAYFGLGKAQRGSPAWPCSNHGFPCLGINTAHHVPFLSTAPMLPSQATLLKSHGFGNAGTISK